jgi:serine/threonine-protein kinase HipA
MPLSARPFTFDTLNRDTYNGLPGLLADSLPDDYGNALIDAWLLRNNIPKGEFTPLDRLCYIGGRGMGALEYRPSVERKDTDGVLDVDMLSSLAYDVLEQRENVYADINDKGLQELLTVGTSAGGARAKAVIALNEDTNEVRSGQLDLPKGYSHWILKFDTETGNKRGYCRIEHAYHEMARACGIDMTECRLLDNGDKVHFMTKRFDRADGKRKHMQTLCGSAHYDFKYPGRYSYEDAAGIMRKIGVPYADMEQLFVRMVFNVILMNRDDHTKNISFLMDGNKKWRLSPAYDVTYAYDPGSQWTSRHQLSVNGKLERIERSDLTAFAQRNGIRDADDIIDLTLSVASEWREYAKLSGVPDGTAEQIGRTLTFV